MAACAVGGAGGTATATTAVAARAQAPVATVSNSATPAAGRARAPHRHRPQEENQPASSTFESSSPKKRRRSAPKSSGATIIERQRRLTLRPRIFNATASPPLARVTTVAHVRREAAWAQDGGSARRRVQEADARRVRVAEGPGLIPSDAVRPDRARGFQSPLYRDCMKTVDA